MGSQESKILDILSKLMDEQEVTSSELQDSYDRLFSIIKEKLPKALDEGLYTDNAHIVRQANRIVEEKEILALVPELAERTMIAVWGQAKSIGRTFKEISANASGVGLNTNLPMIMIPVTEKTESRIYAVTYMDKLISISYEEYRCITREIYKENIDIRRLIRSFVLFYNGDFHHQAYCILPEYVDTDNKYFEIISQMAAKQFLITDEGKIWQKILYKLFHKEVYLFGTDKDLDYFAGKSGRTVHLRNQSKFREICKENDVPCINFAVETELQRLFLDITVFYGKRRNSLKEKAAHLASDSINLKDASVKEHVQKYRRKSVQAEEESERGYRSFVRIRDEILHTATEFERLISDCLMHDLPDYVNTEKYTENLIRILFKHIYADDFEAAKKDIVRLVKANYPYTDAFACLLKSRQGYELEPGDIVRLIRCPDSCDEIAKIKIQLSRELNLSEEDKKKLISAVSLPETGKEYYYFGKKMLDNKEFVMAADSFLKALDNDYEEAGAELIKLAEDHPECGIDIEELAENLVSEANYHVGRDNISQKYKKGIVNLKMAASMKHEKAIEMIADILFDRHKFISWQEMKKEENRNAVGNVIGLYEYLDKRQPKEKYQLKMGLMFCKLKEYARAYALLKGINEPEAQYECARMYQYGNGVARDLKTAKKHYENIKTNYKDSQEQYRKVCAVLEDEKQRRETVCYNADISYSSTSSYSSSSGGCFITTAACLALNEGRDCGPLNELRRFRDTYISGDGEDGDELVKEYYRIAPRIVRYIDREWNPFAVYKELWQEYILPSCFMIREDQNASAKQIYIDMVKSLCRKYDVRVEESIMERYGFDII